jgi:hypothetical protein
MFDGPTGAGRLNRFQPAADGGGVAIQFSKEDINVETARA